MCKVEQFGVLEGVGVIAAVRVPVLELASPGGVELSLCCIGWDAEYEVVIG